MQPERRTIRKLIALLVASRGILSGAQIMIFTVASITVVQLAGGGKGWTGVPSTVLLVGAALIAAPVGRLMDAAGRRVGLSLGHLFGFVGAAVAGWAAVQGSLFLFLLGIFIVGLARGSVELGRYAAAEASPPARRGRAISYVVLGGTVGSIAGPSLLTLSGTVEALLNLPENVGAWPLAMVFFAVGALLLFIFLRPDPRTLAAYYDEQEAQSDADPASREPRPIRDILSDNRARIAVASMIFAQLSMVAVMTITPVHMDSAAHELDAISLVIMAHTMGMFGLSFVTGWLVDRVGRTTMVVAGSLVSAAACVLAPFSLATPWLALALFLLGLGWNFGFVAGSTLLDDILRAAEKGRTQGAADTMVKLASGAASLGSGVIFSAIGFSLTSWLTIIAALIPALLVLLLKTPGPTLPAASPLKGD